VQSPGALNPGTLNSGVPDPANQNIGIPDPVFQEPGIQEPGQLQQARPAWRGHGRPPRMQQPLKGEKMKKGPMHPELPDMTPEQLDKLKKTGLKHLSVMTPLKNQLREKRARLATLMSMTPFEQDQANQLADEIAKIKSAVLKAQIQNDREIRAILTPDQQVIFDSRPKPWLKVQR
jgi:Spy/CpxP family protein refolding chaperone